MQGKKNPQIRVTKGGCNAVLQPLIWCSYITQKNYNIGLKKIINTALSDSEDLIKGGKEENKNIPYKELRAWACALKEECIKIREYALKICIYRGKAVPLHRQTLKKK